MNGDSAYDTIIIGGAIMGSACAYFLAADPGFGGRVLVVERDPALGSSATARSWGGIRQQFSTPGNVRMSLFGAEFVKNTNTLLSVDGDTPGIAFRENGYLFLADGAGRGALESGHAMQTGLGADIAFLESADMARQFPWLETSDLSCGSFGTSREGWFDPALLAGALKRKAVSLGAVFLADECVGVDIAKGRVRAVHLARAGRVACGTVVNAAGPAAAEIARMAGADIPVRPRKRTTFVFDCRSPHRPDMPLTVDPTGVAFRPEGGQYIAIVSPGTSDPDPDATDLEPDSHLFDKVIWPVLAKRVPEFTAIRQTGSWGGHYDLNLFDRNAIIGFHPDIAGLMLCNGFSGHGAQQAPAAGRAVAELIAHGGFRTLDLSAFNCERIAAGRPLTEGKVV